MAMSKVCKICVHDRISTLVDYKHKINEFYKDKYDGLNITDIMEAEMALPENDGVTPTKEAERHIRDT